MARIFRRAANKVINFRDGHESIGLLISDEKVVYESFQKVVMAQMDGEIKLEDRFCFALDACESCYIFNAIANAIAFMPYITHLLHSINLCFCYSMYVHTTKT